MNNQSPIVFGINLGATYSSIAYVDEYGKAVVIPNLDGDHTTPSVVQFEGTNRIVGKEAKNNAILNSDSVVEMVKRHMGDTNWFFNYKGVDYRPEEISSYILRRLADDAEHNLGRPVTDVVITCPAYFGIAQREATARAGEIAGLKVHEVINEPTAAAIFYGMQNQSDQIVLIYDLGGSSFDITAIEVKDGAITVVATGNDQNLGGHQWDEAVVSYLAQRWREETGSSEDPIDSIETLQELWGKAEMVKRSLSVRQETSVPVLHAGQRVGVTITRGTFNELTANLLERTIVYTRDTIDTVGKQGFKSFDQILLVGGSTRMPQVAERLKAEFSMPLKVYDPDESVAKGAATYGKKFLIDNRSQIEPIIYKDQMQKIVFFRGTFLHSFIKNANIPNFYILLDINPDEPWDPGKYEQILKSKQNEWTRDSMRAGTKARTAQKNLEWVPKIRVVIADEAQCKALAAAARTERASSSKAKIEAFERQLAFAILKGYLEKAEFDRFVAEYKDVLSEKEITSHVKVPIQTAQQQTDAPPSQQLEASIAKEIAENLKTVNKKDLYDLLGMPPSSSNALLYNAAEKLYIELLSRHPKTAEVTALQTLAGHAQNIFKSDELRKRYDESRSLSKLNDLLKELDEVVNRSAKRELRGGQVPAFLDKAAKAGFNKQFALEKLQAHARQRSWYVESPIIDLSAAQIRCGNCSAMNDQARQFCFNCNRELVIACPDCGRSALSDEVGCAKCGFPVGNRYWVSDLLDECRFLLDGRNVEAAEEVLRRAERAWTPKKPDILAQKILQFRIELKQSYKQKTENRQHFEGIEVFFSYSHKDEKLVDQLDKHLSTLKHQGLITWYDREIRPGEKWSQEIDKHLNTASIILLLISPDFMYSSYCYRIEMMQALKRHDAGEARIIPIILRPTDLEGTPFDNLQALPKGAKPVIQWPKRDAAYYDIVKGIRRAIREIADK